MCGPDSGLPGGSRCSGPVEGQLAGPPCLPLVLTCPGPWDVTSAPAAHRQLSPQGIVLCCPALRSPAPLVLCGPLPCPQFFPRLLPGLALRLQATSSGSTQLPQTLGLRAAPGGSHLPHPSHQGSPKAPPVPRSLPWSHLRGWVSTWPQLWPRPLPSRDLPCPRAAGPQGLMGGAEWGECMPTGTLSWGQFIP